MLGGRCACAGGRLVCRVVVLAVRVSCSRACLCVVLRAGFVLGQGGSVCFRCAVRACVCSVIFCVGAVFVSTSARPYAFFCVCVAQVVRSVLWVMHWSASSVFVAWRCVSVQIPFSVLGGVVVLVFFWVLWQGGGVWFRGYSGGAPVRVSSGSVGMQLHCNRFAIALPLHPGVRFCAILRAVAGFCVGAVGRCWGEFRGGGVSGGGSPTLLSVFRFCFCVLGLRRKVAEGLGFLLPFVVCVSCGRGAGQVRLGRWLAMML